MRDLTLIFITGLILLTGNSSSASLIDKASPNCSILIGANSALADLTVYAQAFLKLEQARIHNHLPYPTLSHLEEELNAKELNLREKMGKEKFESTLEQILEILAANQSLASTQNAELEQQNRRLEEKNLPTWIETGRLQLFDENKYIVANDISPDRTQLAVAFKFEDFRAQIYNMSEFRFDKNQKPPQPIHILSPMQTESYTLSLKFNSTGDLLLRTADGDPEVRLYDVASDQQVTAINASRPEAADIHPNGRQVLTWNNHHSNFLLWNLSMYGKWEMSPISPIDAPTTNMVINNTAGYSPNGEYIFAATNNRAGLWSTAGKDKKWSLPFLGARVVAHSFSDNSELLAIVTDRNQIIIVHTSDGNTLFNKNISSEITATEHNTPALAISPDGRYLAVRANINGEIQIWDISNSSLIQTLQTENKQNVLRLVFSIENLDLMALSERGWIYKWKISHLKD